MTTTRGPDVSYWQDIDKTPQQINFVQMKNAGAKYVVIRAGQNLWPDPDFSYNWANARIAGLPRGSYWFYDSRVSPEQQAALWASLIGTDKPELEIFIDLEENFLGPYSGYSGWKRMILKLEELLPGQKIGIYTSHGYINGKIPTSEYAFFGKYILWLAYWTKDEDGNFSPIPEYVQIPKPWTQMTFWQWGTPVWGLQFGCESLEIDMNEFMGTQEQFEQRYGLPPSGEGNGNGEIMNYVKITPSAAGEYRSIRNETAYPVVPHILGATSTTQRILANSYAKANPQDSYTYAADVFVSGVLRAKAGDKWWKVFEANGTPMTGWVAEVHLGIVYVNTENVGDPVPPSGVYETWDIKVMSDGSLNLTGSGGLTVNGNVIK